MRWRLAAVRSRPSRSQRWVHLVDGQPGDRGQREPLNRNADTTDSAARWPERRTVRFCSATVSIEEPPRPPSRPRSAPRPSRSARRPRQARRLPGRDRAHQRRCPLQHAAPDRAQQHSGQPKPSSANPVRSGRSRRCPVHRVRPGRAANGGQVGHQRGHREQPYLIGEQGRHRGARRRAAGQAAGERERPGRRGHREVGPSAGGRRRTPPDQRANDMPAAAAAEMPPTG